MRVAFQGVERVTLDGAAGNDAYALVGIGPPLTISDGDKMSLDTLDFSAAADGVRSTSTPATLSWYWAAC